MTQAMISVTIRIGDFITCSSIYLSIYLLCSGLANRNFSSKCWSRFLFLFIFFEHMLCLAGLSCAMGLIRLHDVIVCMCWSLKLMTWLKLKGCQVNVVIFLYGWINRIKHSRTLKTGFNLTKKELYSYEVCSVLTHFYANSTFLKSIKR